jgi:hypothetical protein
LKTLVLTLLFACACAGSAGALAGRLLAPAPAVPPPPRPAPPPGYRVPPTVLGDVRRHADAVDPADLAELAAGFPEADGDPGRAARALARVEASLREAALTAADPAGLEDAAHWVGEERRALLNPPPRRVTGR